MENSIRHFLFALLVGGISLSGVAAKESSAVDGGAAIPELDCVIEPSEIVDIGSAVPGVVESILADRSDLVKKGVVLAMLESSVEQATLDLAKVRAQLNTAIKLRQESAAFGHLTQTRNQKLMQKSVISRQDMDQLQTETRIAELQVHQEKDNKRIAGLEYRRAESILQRRSIRSPVDGVVMDRFKSVGEYVEDQPILRVAQLDPLHVEVIVPVDYLGRVKRGMRAKVTAVVPGSDTHLATVERVDVVADAASGTYGVRLSLPNPGYVIPAGLRCQLAFLPWEDKDADTTASTISTGVTTEKGRDIQTEEIPESALTPEVTVSEPVPEMAVTAAIDQPEACYTMGPVSDEELVGQLTAELKKLTDDLAVRNQSVKVVDNYLLLAAPESDPQATNALIARLRQAGINDYFLFNRGHNKGRVSLGLYNSHGFAINKQNQFAAKGFEAEILPRHKETIQHWLDFSVSAEMNLPDQIRAISTSLTPSPSVKQVACSERLAHR